MQGSVGKQNPKSPYIHWTADTGDGVAKANYAVAVQTDTCKSTKDKQENRNKVEASDEE
jgi:hypothetical protein